MATQAPFEQLKQQAWTAAQEGDLERSVALCDQALDWARAHGDAEQVDRATVNRAAVLVVLGQAAGLKQDLRRILMRSRDAEVSFTTAYTLARVYDAEGDGEKAMFYARIAYRHAVETGNPEQLASAHNQLGDFLVARSSFDEALEEFDRALSHLPPGLNIRRAIALDNRGYCYVVKGRLRKGFGDLVEAVRICRRLGAQTFEASARLSLAYAYLQLGRYEQALRHARRSLDVAETSGLKLTTKYGLFILGEAEKLAGNPLAARYYFCRLQDEFYPNAPNVSDLLLVLNVQGLVNIKAGG